MPEAPQPALPLGAPPASLSPTPTPQAHRDEGDGDVATAADGGGATPATLVDVLPEALVHNCLRRLTLGDVRRCAAVCASFHRAALAIEADVHALERSAVEGSDAVEEEEDDAGPRSSSPSQYRPGPTFANLPNLVRANLSGARWVNAEVLGALAAHCPRLTELNLSRCAGLDQHAALALRRSRSLVEVDFTFCREIRYTVAAQLRRAVPALKTVRRLPAWLTGVFHCPWGELHSYWPDGSFSFTRTTQSRGAVHELEECDGGAFLKDALLYIDAPVWLGSGPQQGVFLREVDRDELPEAERWAEGERSQVLVAQSMEHMTQLATFPDFPAAQVPLTESVHVSAQGSDGREITAMLSRMRVEPLPDDGEQPPSSLRTELDNAAIDDDFFEPELRQAGEPGEGEGEGAGTATIAQAIAMALQQMGVGGGGGGGEGGGGGGGGGLADLLDLLEEHQMEQQ